ncbi:hypothetical protein TcasGA2_TC033039 [Tribolium castaneum]|uniref:Uncharacterized protein n=1 Tax=Tribolium castaneum TaxID=7070 RepID=A0A139WHT6_TRICA|nr:PREDICTED: uncharacterized protein LOC103312920 [Tribolium castaneum]KYB27560.1 hypothetical protein TcasGA2_TC033039 [Tribolium castaneum]|eukprot:XP_008193007.1 PREDICTED: uncharacterized protein LOC103312920 [Tribolium castaneum]
MKTISFAVVALVLTLHSLDVLGYRQCGFCHQKCDADYANKAIPCTSHCFSVVFNDGGVYRGCAPTKNTELPQKCYRWKNAHKGIKECYTCNSDFCNMTPL